MDHWNREDDTVLKKEPELLSEEEIEDEPEKIDLIRFFHQFLRHWKVMLVLMLGCGVIWGVLHPGTSSTTYGARCTFYVPPLITKEVDGKKQVIGNSVMQLGNALGLIQSKIFRDQIAAELGVENTSQVGSYSVRRAEDTELVTITTSSSDMEKAQQLCQAVLDVFQNQAAKRVSINEILVVDPVTGFSNVTVTSTRNSVIKGAMGGFILYCGYALIDFWKDRTLHSRQEAEEYFGLPVLCVLPEFESSESKKKWSVGRRKKA